MSVLSASTTEPHPLQCSALAARRHVSRDFFFSNVHFPPPHPASIDPSTSRAPSFGFPLVGVPASRSTMSAPRRPPVMQYIDDSAQDADHDERFDDHDGDDDEDSAEAAARRHDEPTPSRGEDIDMGDLPPSRPVSPAFGLGVSAQMPMSRAATPAYTPAPDAPTPAYMPAPDGPLFFPGSRGPTPFTYDGRTPTPFPKYATDNTPLFLPDSRGPTPYDWRTPTPFSGGPLPERRQRSSSPPTTKRRRIESSPPVRRPAKNVESFFDMAAEDSDEGEDGEHERDEEDDETLSDREFIDNEPRHDDEEEPPFRLLHRDDDEDLHAVAASYERDAPAYERGLRRPASDFAVPENVPIPPDYPSTKYPPVPYASAPARNAFPVPQLLQSYDHEERRGSEKSRTSNLESLARRPVRLHPHPAIDEPMPIGTWIQFVTGPNKGRVALVTSKKKALVARRGEVGDHDPCEELESSRALDSKLARRATPSGEDIALFARSPRAQYLLQNATFAGPCAALGEGDRIVVVAEGEHWGKTGYIVMLRDVPVVNDSGHKGLARYAQILRQFDPTTPRKKSERGFVVELGRLKRHLLDNPLPLQTLDRVRVVSGLVHRGISGRAIEINGGQVKVEIPSPSNDTPGLDEGRMPDTKCFVIDMRYLSRDFQCGDLVEVVRGLHESRVGMILALRTGGVLEVFDGKDATQDQVGISRAEYIEAKTGKSIFKVRSADVKFVVFGDKTTPFGTAYSGEYTPRSEISHPRPPPADFFTPELRAAWEKKARDYKSQLDNLGDAPDDEDGRSRFLVLQRFLSHKYVSYLSEPTLEEVIQADKSREQRLDKLMRGQRRFVDFPVQITFKTHKTKGRRGVVKSERNDKERDKRAARLAHKGRTLGINDIKGILCLVQFDASNQTEEVPVENLVHPFTYLKLDRAQFLPHDILIGKESLTPLPRALTPEPESADSMWTKTPPPVEPTLGGEDTGEWLCHDGLIGKRLDVVLKGIAIFDNRNIRFSNKWPALEDKTCILVQADTPKGRRVYRDSLTKKKVKVFRPGGPNALPEDVPPPTIKPRRTLTDGTSITQVMQRVVIVGPGRHAPLPENIGRYRETRPDPDTQAAYAGPNDVRVQIEGGEIYLYHISSLCLALNEAILDCPVSVF
ncbi:hypothetical protein C8R44DRAFT_885382 [Mycena epipterygia]|nr:hypothetical protein C8R44DRAFT_885382 [Mycena epipterygia]